MTILRILFAGTILLLLAGCGGPTDDTVRIGVYASLTGATASFGVSSEHGVQMAIDEANAAGGFNGVPFEIVIVDDESKADNSAAAVTRLIDEHKVCAIIGQTTSSHSLKAAPICQKKHIPMISPASTHPMVTQSGDYIFRVCFSDPFQGSVMAKFARGTLEAERVAMLIDRKSEYSEGLARFFRETFERLGGTIVGEMYYVAGDLEFGTQLSTLKETSPDAIYVPGYYQEAGLIGHQARALGITVPLLGGDGWNSPRTVEIAGTALEGSYFSDHFATSDPRPEVQEFVRKYTEKYGARPDAVAPLSYDATGVLLAAIRLAGEPDPKLIRDNLAKTKNYPGITGTISMDALRNPVKSVVVVQIQGSSFTHVATVDPD